MRQPPPIARFFKYPVTAGTAALAIAITGAWWAGWDISALVDNEQVRRGQIWRLVTCIFPHLSIYHIAFNVYWVWVFGTLVEEIFGSVRTALLFILIALGSSAAEYAILSGGLGLSGVGYGLFGFIWVLSRRDARFRGAIDQNTIALFVVWFFICIALTVTHIMPVANIAHGAGALVGALIGLSISVTPAIQRLAVGGGLVAFLAAGVAGSTIARGYINLSRDSAYEARLGYDALKQERNDAAVSWLRDATRIEPDSASNWFNMGIAYQRLNKIQEATTSYRRASELRPNDEDFRRAAKLSP